VQLNKTNKFKLKKEKCVARLGTISVVRPLCSMCALLMRHFVEKNKPFAGKMRKKLSHIQLYQLLKNR